MSDYKDLANTLRAEAEVKNALQEQQDRALIEKLLEIYDQKSLLEFFNTISPGEWNRESLKSWINKKGSPRLLTDIEFRFLEKILPEKPTHFDDPDFTFADLFAGIGGIRKGFEGIGGKCIFSSEWNKYSVRTYKANWYCGEDHTFNQDIRDITLSNTEKYGDVSEYEAIDHINKAIPGQLNVLLAGFPCQPFSLAGVSKKNALGRAHGFECETQGTLFFDIEMIIKAKRPEAFVLENVKNLKSHDKGKTFRVIRETLDRLGYWVADTDHEGPKDPKIVDGQTFTPQHRERIVLVGFRKDLNVHEGFSLKDISKLFPETRPSFKEILDESVEEKYQLTPRLWEYLYEYAITHAKKGNGFGYGLVNPNNPNVVARTLSARYHKDGSEILVDAFGWDMKLAETDFWHKENQEKRPRRLTPRECSRLMGFDQPGKSSWKIPVSDTQAYRQFGNSVVVPVFEAVAKLMKPRIMDAIKASASEQGK